MFYAKNRYVMDGMYKTFGPVFRMITSLDSINNTYLMADTVYIYMLQI